MAYHEYQAFFDKKLKPSLDAYASARQGAGRRVCVISGTGHGDQARAIAFCNALRDAEGDIQTFLVMHLTGREGMVEIDYLHEAVSQFIIVGGVPIQHTPPQALIPYLRSLDMFDIIYDVAPYAVGTFTPDVARLAVSNYLLSPFRILYDGFPFENWRLKYMPGLSQWDLMRLSSGVEVDEAHLIFPTRCAPRPSGHGPRMRKGKTDWEKVKPGKAWGRFVLLHNGAGTGMRMKMAPPDVMVAVARRLKKMGIFTAQLRFGDEQKIDGCKADLHNLRVPLVAEMMLHRDCLGLVTIEGFLPYIAAATGLPATVLFGPTPVDVFGFPQNLNLVRRDPEEKRAPCPIGSCFWEPSVLGRDNWARRCWMDEEYCRNFVCPEEAANQVEYFVKKRMDAG